LQYRPPAAAARQGLCGNRIHAVKGVRVLVIRNAVVVVVRIGVVADAVAVGVLPLGLVEGEGVDGIIVAVVIVVGVSGIWDPVTVEVGLEDGDDALGAVAGRVVVVGDGAAVGVAHPC
jgi:hypothetical protein